MDQSQDISTQLLDKHEGLSEEVQKIIQHYPEIYASDDDLNTYLIDYISKTYDYKYHHHLLSLAHLMKRLYKDLILDVMFTYQLSSIPLLKAPMNDTVKPVIDLYVLKNNTTLETIMNYLESSFDKRTLKKGQRKEQYKMVYNHFTSNVAEISNILNEVYNAQDGDTECFPVTTFEIDCEFVMKDNDLYIKYANQDMLYIRRYLTNKSPGSEKALFENLKESLKSNTITDESMEIDTEMDVEQERTPYLEEFYEKNKKKNPLRSAQDTVIKYLYFLYKKTTERVFTFKITSNNESTAIQKEKADSLEPLDVETMSGLYKSIASLANMYYRFKYLYKYLSQSQIPKEYSLNSLNIPSVFIDDDNNKTFYKNACQGEGHILKNIEKNKYFHIPEYITAAVMQLRTNYAIVKKIINEGSWSKKRKELFLNVVLDLNTQHHDELIKKLLFIYPNKKNEITNGVIKFRVGIRVNRSYINFSTDVVKYMLKDIKWDNSDVIDSPDKLKDMVKNTLNFIAKKEIDEFNIILYKYMLFITPVSVKDAGIVSRFSV